MLLDSQFDQTAQFAVRFLAPVYISMPDQIFWMRARSRRATICGWKSVDIPSHCESKSYGNDTDENQAQARCARSRIATTIAEWHL